MASAESQTEGTKKRRLRGACDICRRQKIRCDSAKQPGGRCSNCVSFGSECTHNLSQLKEEKGPRRKRTNAKNGTDEANRAAESTARLVQTAKSVVDGLLKQTYNAPQDRDELLELLLQVSRYARSLEHELDSYRQSQSPPTDRSTTSPRPDSNDDDEGGVVMNREKMPEYLRRITAETSNHRYYGKNSSVLFVQGVMEMRSPAADMTVPNSTRPVYWTRHPWEVYPDPIINQVFPPADLFRDLVDIYFTEINIYMNILHRPSFEKAIAEGLHLRNHRFGAIVLAVCALAGKNSPDERVLLPGADELSAGWEWFRQVRRPFSGPVVEPASLYELQLCCLYILFHVTSNVESCWVLSGIGILYAQDVGADQRDTKGPLTAEAELTRRSVAFLITFDSVTSVCFGRTTVAMAGRTELPRLITCDDEYWDLPNPKMAFKQPPGKPSLAAFTSAYFELMKVFTSKGSLATASTDPDTVAEFDVLLNRWVNDIPEHLLWNPFQENDIFFEQSATLYASFYHVQIMVHRLFIRTLNSSTFKSLAICTNAARSCSQIADVKSRRGGILPPSQFIKSAFDSAVVLLLNVFGGTRSGLSIDTARELVDVYKCMRFLKQTEHRCQIAGRFYDILYELLSTSNLPLPPAQTDRPFGTSRTCPVRTASSPAASTPSTRNESQPHTPPQTTNGASSSAGYSFNGASTSASGNTDNRNGTPLNNPNGTADTTWPDHFFSSLPMAVEDLSSLPIYGSLDSLETDILGSMSSITSMAPMAASKESLQYLAPLRNAANEGAMNGNGNYDRGNYDMSPFNTYMATDEVLSTWIPYFSTVDEMMQGVAPLPPRPAANVSGLGI
ncbi:hypothetical protein C8F04DRAFT_1302933 [Mycena alexandri]|uniref:Zn(2)-C6 fungal-type domain-containing protein n=1 Tax=Mycena alexandri TaxID=1745969 RepID=A0AAD6SF62_9AGAR|nr:hypothetical protein C8F04DRAFT_1302933 [Mycena alexandri]